MAQLDMFGDTQPDLFSGNVPTQPSIKADPDRVRRRLQALLAEALAAGPYGLPTARRRLIETVVPQMTLWLPEEEAKRVQHDFLDALSGG